MHLKRLELFGFKSFALKTRLGLEPGITAIVGPNGSGKSNIADAIRWCLGEQSVRNLRLKKSEEVVFAGTDKRARSGLAEVSLLFDNPHGAGGLDFSEVEISRRLYRNGESEYLLNGRKAKLGELQQLLATAGFGANSYSVIGQGMIDTFVLATPAERKLLFDEASGIRQYEIKREQAQRRLDETQSNLVRAQDILAELGPRLASLGRSVEAAKERQELSRELEERRRRFVLTGMKDHQQQIANGSRKLSSLKKELAAAKKAVVSLSKRRRELEEAENNAVKESESLTRRLSELEAHRDQLANELSAQRAQLHVLTERAGAKSRLPIKVAEVSQELDGAEEALSGLHQRLEEARKDEAEEVEKLERFTHEISTAQRELSKLRRETDQSSQNQYILHALAILKEVVREMGSGRLDAERIKLMVYKAGRLLSNASKGQLNLAEEVKRLQGELTTLMKKRDDAHELYTGVVIKVRSLEIDAAHAADKAERLRHELAEASRELDSAELPSPEEITELKAQIQTTDAALKRASKELAKLRQQAAEPTESPDSGQVFELAGKLEAAKTALERLKAESVQAEESLSRSQQAVAQFEEMSRSWFGSVVRSGESSQESLEEQERALTVLETRIADRTTADADTLSEYEEVKGRHDFLSGQIKDLEAAKSDLEKVSTQLEGLIKDRFESAFKDISDHFGEYFKKLFGGGSAGLKLDQDEAGAYGIEIKATPPGKRVESLAMLSGGERSLTGIALLAAILRVNPSPFVVMDEVDAALDEANSARFAEILRDVSKRSQLLVITHNRQTMKVARALFGVTMDEYHVSRLLSIKLEEARELAAK